MNKIITNLSLISDAAEYFDRKTGAAWKIRSSLTNMLVWSANSYLFAVKSDDTQRQFNAMVQLATLRVWADDANTSSLVLDLTSNTVRKTLGLERVVDVHEEACREARTKCIQTRSAVHFHKYYEAAMNAHEERRRQREENVEAIAELLSDSSFELTHELIDHMRTFEGMNPGINISDADLYDDASIERQADTLAECVGNCLESMYDVCDSELAAAITANKVQRLTGYHRAIMQMMEIAGVDTKRLAERRIKLEALIDSQMAIATKEVMATQVEIEAQIAAMQAEEAAQKPKAKRRTVERGGKKVTTTAPMSPSLGDDPFWKNAGDLNSLASQA